MDQSASKLQCLCLVCEMATPGIISMLQKYLGMSNSLEGRKNPGDPLYSEYIDKFATLFNVGVCARHQCGLCHKNRSIEAYYELVNSDNCNVDVKNCMKHWCYIHQIEKSVILPSGDKHCPLEVCFHSKPVSGSDAHIGCYIVKKNTDHPFCENICKQCFSRHIPGQDAKSKFCDGCKCCVKDCNSNNIKPSGLMCMDHYKDLLFEFSKSICQYCGFKYRASDRIMTVVGCPNCACRFGGCKNFRKLGGIVCNNHKCECLVDINPDTELYEGRSKLHIAPDIIKGLGLKNIQCEYECPNKIKPGVLYECELKHGGCLKYILMDGKQSNEVEMLYDYSSHSEDLKFYASKNYGPDLLDRTYKIISCGNCANAFCISKGCFLTRLRDGECCIFHTETPTVCFKRNCKNPLTPLLPENSTLAFIKINELIRLCESCAADGAFISINMDVVAIPKNVSIYPIQFMKLLQSTSLVLRKSIHNIIAGTISGHRKIKAGTLRLINPIDRDSLRPIEFNQLWFSNLLLYRNYESAFNITLAQLQLMETSHGLSITKSFATNQVNDGELALLHLSTLSFDLIARILSFLN